MRMIPPAIHNPRSDAEVRVFTLLERTDFGAAAVALHSLNVSEHAYKQWSELDFVVLGPSGLYVLEIKGGRVRCDGEGIWTFTNRFGEEYRKSESPFGQAMSGMYALKGMMEQEFAKTDLRAVCFGWGVVIPDQPFEVRSVEIPPAVVLDENGLRGKKDLREYLHGVAEYWRGKGHPHRDLVPAELLRRILQFLRPTFDIVPSLAASVDHLYQKQVCLTDEQYDYMDCVEEAPRIVCEGGAGTGKSFLAVEAARREGAAGNSVLFVCRSPVFSAFITARLSKARGVTVVDYGRLTPFMAGEGKSGKYDVLVVDEGQDLLDLVHLEALGNTLKGGLENGRWRYFLDPNNQGGIYGDQDQDAYEWLKSLGATPLRLKRNCRNTEQIVLQTMLMTGADIGTAVIEGKGPKVTFRYVSDGKDTAHALSAQLTEWVGDGVTPGDISILSPEPIEKSCVRYLNDRWQKIILRVTTGTAGGWPPNRLTFSTIRDFKGLENRVVAVVDLEGYDGSQRAVAELYVAMTRANAVLWVGVPESVRESFERDRAMHAKELAKIISGGC